MALLGSTPVSLRAATHPATAPASPAAASETTHSVVFIGDSWTYGQGATDLRGYAVLTGEQLGWRYDAIGVPGSGYTQLGSGATFDDRVGTAVAEHPDVLVVEGSLNERNSTPQALSVAADATLAHLHAAAEPGTHVIVLGATYSPGTPDATIDWINAAIKGAADRYGMQFVDPAAEAWIDPHDAALWHDQNHPDDAGYQLVADRLEPLVRAAVGS